MDRRELRRPRSRRGGPPGQWAHHLGVAHAPQQRKPAGYSHGRRLQEVHREARGVTCSATPAEKFLGGFRCDTGGLGAVWAHGRRTVRHFFVSEVYQALNLVSFPFRPMHHMMVLGGEERVGPNELFVVREARKRALHPIVDVSPTLHLTVDHPCQRNDRVRLAVSGMPRSSLLQSRLDCSGLSRCCPCGMDCGAGVSFSRRCAVPGRTRNPRSPLGSSLCVPCYACTRDSYCCCD